MTDLKAVLQTITSKTNTRFRKAKPAELKLLEPYNLPPSVIAFYKDHAPAESIYGQVSIKSIDEIVEENEKLWPGACCSKHGYIVFASNDGDAYCFDLTKKEAEHPPIVLLSHEIVNPDTTPEDYLRLAKPVATNLQDFLEQFTRSALDTQPNY